MTSFFTFTVSRQPKTSVIVIFFVIPFFLNELSSNLVHQVKIRRLFILVAQKLRDNFYSVLEIELPWQQLRSLVTKKYTK